MAAAGGVVWRRTDGVVEVAVVHRPRYDDWSLPKGKLDRGESFEDAALREVEEEIGACCALGEELSPTTYRDNKGRSKIVRYWLMQATGEFEFVANEEVDELRWLVLPDALALLSYDRDRALLAQTAQRLS